MMAWSLLEVDFAVSCFMLVSCVAEDKGDMFLRNVG
jgi:hypothetical protein